MRKVLLVLFGIIYLSIPLLCFGDFNTDFEALNQANRENPDNITFTYAENGDVKEFHAIKANLSVYPFFQGLMSHPGLGQLREIEESTDAPDGKGKGEAPDRNPRLTFGKKINIPALKRILYFVHTQEIKNVQEDPELQNCIHPLFFLATEWMIHSLLNHPVMHSKVLSLSESDARDLYSRLKDIRPQQDERTVAKPVLETFDLCARPGFDKAQEIVLERSKLRQQRAEQRTNKIAAENRLRAERRQQIAAVIIGKFNRKIDRVHSRGQVMRDVNFRHKIGENISDLMNGPGEVEEFRMLIQAGILKSARVNIIETSRGCLLTPCCARSEPRNVQIVAQSKSKKVAAFCCAPTCFWESVEACCRAFLCLPRGDNCCGERYWCEKAHTLWPCCGGCCCIHHTQAQYCICTGPDRYYKATACQCCRGLESWGNLGVRITLSWDELEASIESAKSPSDLPSPGTPHPRLQMIEETSATPPARELEE